MGQGRPGVFYKQVDLSQIVVGADSSVMGIAGSAKWGPTDKIQSISQFDQFVQLYGKPVSPSLTPMHYQVLGFLKLGKGVFVVRPKGGSKYGGAEALQAAATLPVGSALVNLPSVPSGANVIGLYTKYAGVHDTGTIYVKTFGADPTTGEFSIQVGTKLNVTQDDFDKSDPFYEEHLVSVISTAKDGFGKSMFIQNVLDSKSLLLAGRAKANAAVDEVPSDSVALTALSQAVFVQANTSEIGLAYNKFKSLSAVTLDFVVPGSFDTDIINKCIEVAQTRGDCIAIVSPDVSVFGGVDEVSGPTGWKSNISVLNEFGCAYGTYYLIKDEYNSQDVYVPAAGHVAGAFALNDSIAEPWYAPAGPARASQNVKDLGIYWEDLDQDTLYDRNINFATKTPKNGITVQGQKTLLGRNSALQRINVARCILYIKRALLAYLEDFIYEFNNEFNRKVIYNGVGAFLKGVKTGQGLYDYRVVCDETNNTDQVIDSNEIRVDIYLKPTKVGEFLFLKSIITATSVNFDDLISKQPA